MAKKNFLTKEEINHLADLSKLNLSDKEIKIFPVQLSEILNYVSQLNNIETDSVAPTNQAAGLENVFSAGNSQPLTSKQALANAKNKERNLFKTKAVL